MRPLLLAPLLLAPFTYAQSKSDPPLAPFRAAAHQAFAAEMAGANQPLCPNLVAPAKIGACLDASLKQSEAHLAAYRSALRSALAARQQLLGSQALNHFDTTERLWDTYSARQLKASADMVQSPELAGGAEVETRIDLIRAHLGTLDRIYSILLHSDCGACLVDH